MNTQTTPSPNTFEQRLVSVERGVRLFSVTMLLLSSAPNLVLAFSIKTYAAVLPNLVLLPDLSPVTQFVFAHPAYVIALAILWPVAGTFITLRARDPFRALLASCVYLALVVVQFALTWFAFVAPIRAVLALLRSQ